jgi:DNA mismatch repair ATPase MutS
VYLKEMFKFWQLRIFEFKPKNVQKFNFGWLILKECMVSDDKQSITFLYKFGNGACPKSHGFNAARLADIPDEIIKVGSLKSVEFENFTIKIQLLK